MHYLLFENLNIYEKTELNFHARYLKEALIKEQFELIIIKILVNELKI